jgi:multiple sugar transport system substrate-binding protein
MAHRIRRFAAALVAVAIAGTGLSACSSSGSSGDVTLEWWAPNLTANLNDDQKYYQELVQPFTDDTGIKVKVQVNAWGDYYNKILGAITSGDGADLISTGTTWVSTLTDSGGFVQFGDDDMKAIGGSGQFVPAALSAAGGDNKGGPSMIPWVSGVTQMWYNPKLFAAAGISEPPATWPEFVADAKKLTQDTNGDGTPDQWGFGYPAGFAQEWAHTMFAFGEQNGAPFFTKDGKANLDNKGMVAAAKQFTDLMTVDKVMSPSTVEDTSFDRTNQDFIAGKVAMVFEPGANAAFEAAGFSDYKVAQIPLDDPLTGAKVTTHIAGVNLGVFADTKHKAETLQLLKYLSSEAVQVKLFNHIPSILPGNKAAYDSDKVKKDDVFLTSEKILKTTAAGYPINSQAAQAETVIGDAMKKIVAQAATSGSMSTSDIQSVLDEANSQLKASQ